MTASVRHLATLATLPRHRRTSLAPLAALARLLWMPSLSIALLIACASDGGGGDPFGGQTGSEAPPCKRLDPAELATDEVSPLGFSPAEILEFAQGEHSAELLWASGETTTLTAQVTPTGPASFQDIEPLPSKTDASMTEGPQSSMTEGPQSEPSSQPEPSSEIGAACEDMVVIPVRVTVSSADGRLEDEIEANLEARHKEEATLFKLLAPDAVDYEITEIDLEDHEGVKFHIDASFGPTRFEGRVFGQGTETESDGTASVTNIDVATWGDQEPE